MPYGTASVCEYVGLECVNTMVPQIAVPTGPVNHYVGRRY